MGISGLIGAGAQDALAEILQRQLLERQQAEVERARQEGEKIQRERLDLDRTREGNEQTYRQQALDAQAQARREASNRFGVEDMLSQREAMDKDAERQRRDVALNNIRAKNSLAADMREVGGSVDYGDVDPTAGLDRLRQEARIRGDEQIRVARSTPRAESGQQWVIGQDGQETFRVPQPGDRPRPADPRPGPTTGMERDALGFYMRGQQADKIAAPLETKIAQMSLGGQAALEWLPNFMQSSEGQAYRQAQRQFTEARLRDDSGAAIPPNEFENDARMYFAQPGDKPEVIAQKQAARREVLASIAQRSGKAWAEHYGEDAPMPGGAPANGGGVRFTAPGVVPPQGGGVVVGGYKVRVKGGQ